MTRLPTETRAAPAVKRAVAIGLLAVVVAVTGAALAQPSPPPTIGPTPDDAGATAADLGAATSNSHPVRWEVSVGSPPNDDGKKLRLTWKRDTKLDGSKLLILRHEVGPSYVAATDHRYVGQHQTPILAADFLHPEKLDDCETKPLDASALAIKPGTEWGQWVVAGVSDDKDGELVEEVSPGTQYVYALAPVLIPDEDKPAVTAFLGEAVLTRPRAAAAAGFDRSRWFFLAFVLMTGAAFLIYIQIAKRRGKDMFIRRIPGVDAIEDAVGRSTEMGRPVLYVTGIEEITDIQTIASLLILGHVAEMTAEYDTEIKVCNTYPMTMVVAEEIVRNSYTNVGRADAHRPENIMFITSEQFAFAAAVNGMILRDRPATNIYLGRFFAESLILSETGFLAGAVQIAGTAEFTQLPFFVAACDYTLIGEELYATGAYLSREPNQVAQIKAGDVMKVVATALIIAGVIAATAQGYNLIGALIP
jgi:hypothetical protein